MGIMTRRDLKFQEDDNRPVGEVMTRESLITAPENTTLDDADDPFDRATWPKANPNLGISVYQDDIERLDVLIRFAVPKRELTSGIVGNHAAECA